jgi:ABC-type phosphate transport system substrate-binding protein
MNFKLSHIAAASAVAFVASSAVAGPISPNVDPAQYTTGTTDIYLAGSSAVDLALTKFIANSCNPSTLDTYRTDSGGKTYYLWTCQTNNTAPSFVLPSGNTKIAIHKNTNSSSDGTKLVENGAAAALFLQVSDLAACSVSPSVVPATATIPSYNVFGCGNFAGTLSHTVRFGFSDSEPAQYDSANAGQLKSAYPLTIIFGIPVTQNVRDALQAAQGLTVGDESEANMPSLTSTQINSIYTGRFSSWANLGITIAGTDNSIYRVQRSGGSGTTRAFDATFIRDNCVPGLTPMGAATALATATLATQCVSGATKALQAGTSDDVASCLNNFASTGNAGAIAYLSTDYQPAAADGYRWIKIDGYAPKLLNVADGKWNDWSEESLNYNLATPLATGSDDLGFYNTIKATSASATLISEIAKNLPQSTSGQWTGGVMGALPGAKNAAGWGLAAGTTVSLPRTDATMLALPANTSTRATSTGYNLCAMPAVASGFAAH